MELKKLKELMELKTNDFPLGNPCLSAEKTIAELLSLTSLTPFNSFNS